MRSLLNNFLTPSPSACLSLGVALLTLNAAAATAPVSTPGLRPPGFSTLNVPLFFEPADDHAQNAYIARGQDCQVLVTPTQTQIALVRKSDPESLPLARENAGLDTPATVRFIRMELVGANEVSTLSGAIPSSGKINRLCGQDSEWRTGLPTFAQVRAASVYDGIDLVYYGNQQQLEFDFHVAPGADPGPILMKFSGADSIEIDSSGALVLRIGQEEIRQHCPVIYQIVKGEKTLVPGSYERRGERTIGFKLGQYRKDLPLTIDPVLSYASYFGGSSGDISLVIRLGPDQSIYVAGETLSPKFPFPSTPDAFQKGFKGGTVSGDAFIAKFDSTGSNLVYFTYLGGSAEDGALDLAVDGDGNAYVVGLTTSANFPVRNPIYKRIRSQKNPYLGTYSKDGFVSVLNASGSGLIYSTYLGGQGSDVVTAVAVDSTGAAWITGTTSSTNFPVVNPLAGQRRATKRQDGFVTKIAPGGGSFLFSTYFGGSNTDVGQGIACDTQGSAYVVGYTASQNIPITNAFQTKVNNSTNVTGALDAFIAKFSTEGALLYSTFLGAGGDDGAYRVAVDGSGNAYLTGYTQSKNFPNTLTNIAELTNTSARGVLNPDAFLVKVGVDGNGAAQLLYSGIFGGHNSDSGWDVAVSPNGDAYIIGMTTSWTFPTNSTSPGFLSPTNSGGIDVFVAALKADASGLLFSGYLGGSRADYGYGIALSPGAEVYITGRTVSKNFPLKNAGQNHRNGANDAFIAVISPEPVLQAAAAADGYDLLWWGGIGPEFTVEVSAPSNQWAPLDLPIRREGGWRKLHVPADQAPAAFFRLQRQ